METDSAAEQFKAIEGERELQESGKNAVGDQRNKE
jgi:hypothetical protein